MGQTPRKSRRVLFITADDRDHCGEEVGIAAQDSTLLYRAVSPISDRRAKSDGQQVWKPATQQTWKSALLFLRPARNSSPRQGFFFGLIGTQSELLRSV